MTRGDGADLLLNDDALLSPPVTPHIRRSARSSSRLHRPNPPAPAFPFFFDCFLAIRRIARFFGPDTAACSAAMSRWIDSGDSPAANLTAAPRITLNSSANLATSWASPPAAVPIQYAHVQVCWLVWRAEWKYSVSRFVNTCSDQRVAAHWLT